MSTKRRGVIFLNKINMSDIINLEEIRLSKLDHNELLVESIERMTEQILIQTELIKDLTERVDFFENKALPLLFPGGID